MMSPTNTDDDDQETPAAITHRTVDEILLLYDSESDSDSSSTGPLPSPPHSRSPLSASADNCHNDNTTTNNWYLGAGGGSPSASSAGYISQLGHVDTNNYYTLKKNISSNGSNDSHNINNSSLDFSSAPPNSNPRYLLSHAHSLDSSNFVHTSSSVASSIARVNSSSSSISSSARVNSADFSLFTAVKSNFKPGAALAAAAAASRSIPTPHAAAIKLSRINAAGNAALGPLPDPVSDSGFSSVSSQTSPPDDTDSRPGSDDVPNDILSTQGGGLRETSIEKGEAGSSRQFSAEVKHEDFRLREQNVIDQAAEDFPTNHSPPIESDDDDASAGGGMITSFPLDTSNFDSPAATFSDFDEHLVAAASVPLVYGQIEQFEAQSPSEAQVKDGDGNKDRPIYSSNSMGQEDMDPIVPHSDRVKIECATDEMHGQEDVIFEPEDEVLSSNSGDDITDIVQDAAFRDTHKMSQKISLSPLELAEELEKKQAFTGMHWEEGAVSQPMRLEGVRRGSTVLGYFDVDSSNTITRMISLPAFRKEHGYPLVISVHLYSIAIGMSKGTIAIVPSKYSLYQFDNMDGKMSMFALSADKSAPVTSMCFSQQGDYLFAGYENGLICLWDMQRPLSPIKYITEHKAPLVHLLYLGQDSQVGKQFNIVSGDSKGVVKLIRFSIVPLFTKIYYKATILCDEKMGVVICASSLISGDFLGGALMTSQGSNMGTTSAIGNVMGGVIGVDPGSKYSSAGEDGVFIFAFHQYALVAKLVPSTENVVKYAHIPKPDGVGEGSLPYASWRCISDSNGSSTETVRAETSEKVSFLALAWERKVQVAKLVKSELKVYWKWTLESPAVGVAWLDDQILVVLTSIGQLGMFTRDGSVIHQTSFSVDACRGDDLITYHTYFNNSYGIPEKAYHNCVAVRGASIYVLGPSHLVVSRLLPWKERIEVLRRAGDWMEALNMAMTLYDGQAHGVIDLPRALADVQKTIMPYLAQLLLSYVDEVFSYLEVASGNQVGNSGQLDESKCGSFSDHPEIKEQYIRVGGVAVEFCVHIKRTDILFDDIYTKFDAAKHKETFLELLEPYILKDMLGCLPPAIMQSLVEHYSGKGWLQRVEQCVLHMDISSLDFNQVVRLCREHRLHGALIYLFNKGLDDFRTPLEELLVVLKSCNNGSASALGYRILVYLRYCFQGLAFPPGHGTLPSTLLSSIREEILRFLLDFSSIPNSGVVTNLQSHGQYRNLCHLLELDTEATLDVLKSAFVVGEVSDSNYLYEDSINSNVDSTEVKVLGAESQNLLQNLVDVLSVILEESYFQRVSFSSHGSGSMETWPSKNDACYMLEFITYYVADERAKVSRATLSHILEHLTSDVSLSSSDSDQNNETRKRREKLLLSLLDVVPDADWDAPYLLELCERCQFYQACGFIHSTRHQYLAALDSYVKVGESIHAFSFIHDMLQQSSVKEFDGFRAAVFSRIVDLVKLNREGAFFIVVYHFYGQSQQILFSELQSDPESLFLYMKTLVDVHKTGNLQFACFIKYGIADYSNGRKARHQSDRVKKFLEALSDFPKMLRSNPIHLTDEITELYFELLCRYEQESARKFLETFENYRVEYCLRLCQEYGIVDAAAFLLERVGDVGNALLLILSCLDEKFIILDTSIEDGQSDPAALHLNIVMNRKEVRDILDVVHSCIRLCQRNSPRLNPHESEHLWFRLLDSFCLPLTDTCIRKVGSMHETCMQPPDESLVKHEDEEECKIKWKILKFQKNSHILRKLLSLFIREIVEGMIGYVPIPTIMLKLLSDNGIQEFGDFKPTILGMLGTYDFERRILDTAKSLIEDDTYYTMSLLKKGASHAYAPQDQTCCICNCSLSKNSSSRSIQVFSCGHAVHVNCAFQETETSSEVISAGCPICVAGKKALRSSESVFVYTGLVASSKLHKGPGTNSLHPSDSDAFENSYGYHPISRFELLNSIDKDQRTTQIENMPQLRLAPPAVYHEKVKKGINLATEENIVGSLKPDKSSSRQLRDIRVKGSSVRFPLRSNMFGKEKRSKPSS